MSKPWRRLRQIFVAFSEKLNFNNQQFIKQKKIYLKKNTKPMKTVFVFWDFKESKPVMVVLKKKLSKWKPTLIEIVHCTAELIYHGFGSAQLVQLSHL